MLLSSEKSWELMRDGVLILGDAGKNFIETQEEQSIEQYLSNAKKIVDTAAETGIHALKWQTHTVDDEQLNIDVTSTHFIGSDRYSWVTRNTNATPLEAFWKPLKEYSEKKGVTFFSTPMSRGAAILLEELGVPFWKIGSGDILDFVMLDFIRRTGKPILISSGMSTLEEVSSAIEFLHEKNKRVCLLHCVSKYPCPAEDLRLGTIKLFQEKFQVPIGFSDHSIGNEDAFLACAVGATVVEKHFSLSREFWGSDHKVSMLPNEARALVDGIVDLQAHPEKKEKLLKTERAVIALRNKEKVLQDSEALFRPLFRKSLVFGGDLPAGTVITKEMIYAMRPQKYIKGLSSEKYEDVVGRTLTRSVNKYDQITPEDLH